MIKGLSRMLANMEELFSEAIALNTHQKMQVLLYFYALLHYPTTPLVITIIFYISDIYFSLIRTLILYLLKPCDDNVDQSTNEIRVCVYIMHTFP